MTYIYIYIYICTHYHKHMIHIRSDPVAPSAWPVASLGLPALTLRSIPEISSCFFGPRPWHIEIRHRVKKAFTINLFGFETLKLKT